MDVLKENMKMVGVTKEEAKDRVRWRHMIRWGVPERDQLKEEEVLKVFVLSGVLEVGESYLAMWSWSTWFVLSSETNPLPGHE